MTLEEQGRCGKAETKLHQNPRHPGLNLEHLGKVATHNHHSIRASRELRIILGVEPNLRAPENVILAYAGHHDPAYSWSEKRGYHTDMADGVPFPDSSQTIDLEQRQKFFANSEEWQLFLHPDQERLVHKKFFGEARILGAAGTGKTVLALHRAAYLGKHYPQEKVLFTTFSKSLLEYLRDLYQGIPDAPNNVDFINIDKLAYDVVGGPPIDVKKESDFFDEAYKETIPNTLLKNSSDEYLKEEINRIIKGRGAGKDEYLDTGKFQRYGRKQGFNRESREICWNLKEAWDMRLQQAGLVTFADNLVAARDKARQNGAMYRAILADEYQDITLVGAQFLRALVADDRDKVPDNGLLFFGDVAQRIYAGGWSATSANLKFTGQGRSETIHTNYRNTRRIMEAAVAVRGTTNTGADQGEQISGVKDFILKDGNRPVFFKVSETREISIIANEIEKLIQNESLKHEQIGILVLRNEHVKLIHETLEKNFNLQCFSLNSMRENKPEPGIRIGTFDRGKGMEFQAVFLPRLGASLFPGSFVSAGPEQGQLPGMPPEALSAEEEEQRQLQLDRLYVGMTRAVSFLYLLADEEPCRELLDAEHCFEWR